MTRAEVVEGSRKWLRTWGDGRVASDVNSAVVTLADDLAEARALLEAVSLPGCQLCDLDDEADTCEEDPPCQEHRRRLLVERTR